ncbi:diguanylate cyclase (GGDEF)-like protein [Paenibacillus phyllosphaerae]|uniref:Diguanylate cyclase (GGDEF)-like protein n=1 Tax=Paenibacillus phyllosphaerae TaxID=274593 RepID=A0A7W5FQA5_9BACL|nr:diguanylate cyclase [Paenibacillus phyllosphaerae]MBB3113275.1 diguanylate cyclase (GGDEF)-like protein [Paenibacillus phyllosphaerae]
MQAINNRYANLQSVPADVAETLFLATDLEQEERRVLLRVIAPHLLPMRIGQLYQDLLGLSSLRYPGIPQLYDFGAVNVIDGASPPEELYFCAYEYVTGTPLLQAMEGNDPAQVVPLFIQVCHMLTYLHGRGYIHGHIDADDLVVQPSDEGEVVKFQGVVLTEVLEKALYPKRGIHSLNRAPEWYISYTDNVKTDYFALGVLLLHMLVPDSRGSADVAQRLEKEKAGWLRSGAERALQMVALLDIARKLTEEDPEDRYAQLYEVVQAINAAMGTHYPLVRTEYAERFVNRFPLIGEQDQQVQLMASLERAWCGQLQPRAALITGEAGIGKSRMLEELSAHLLLERTLIFKSGNAETDGLSYAAIVPILRQLTQQASATMLEQYGAELVKLIPDEPKLQGFQPSASLAGDKERIRLRIRLTHFLKDMLGGKRALFLIDDAHLLDPPTLEWLDYVMSQMASLPLFLVFAYRDHDVQADASESLYYFRRWQTAGMAELVRLRRFSEEETGLMIKSLLGMDRAAPKFTQRIYQESQGNPAFIKHILLALHMEKKLYVNDFGRWSTDFDSRGDYSVLPLPLSVDDAIMKQVALLGHAGAELLDVIAVFQGDVPLPLLERLNDSSHTSCGLQELLSLQLIERHDAEYGDCFGFHSNLVKKAVYNRLPASRRTVLHRRCAEELGHPVYEGDNKIRLERLHHLLQLRDYAAALALIFEVVDYFLNYYMREQALLYLQTGLWVAEELGDTAARMRALHLMGVVYLGQGDNDRALERFEQSLRFALELADIGMEVDIKCLMADLYLRRNERLPIETLLTSAIELSLAADYKKGLLEAVSLYIRVADAKTYQERLASLEERITPEDEARYPEQMAKLFKARGIFFMHQTKYREAEESFLTSVELFRSLDKLEDYANTLTNLGVIAVLHHDDLALARQYFESALEGALRSGSPHAVTHYSNLLEISVSEDKYGEALEYLKLAETLAVEYDFTLRMIGLSISGLHLYTQLSDYQKAYKYLQRSAELTSSQGPDSSWVMPEFHERSAYFYYEMGDFDKALSSAAEGLRECREYHETEKMYCTLLMFLAASQRDRQIEWGQLEQLLQTLRGSKYVRMFRYFLHHCAELLLDLGKPAEAGTLLAESAGLSVRASSTRLEAELLWLEGRYESGPLGMAKLEQAIAGCKEAYAESIAWKARMALGVIYESLGELEQARASYVLGLDELYQLTEKVPEPLRPSFLQAHGRYWPRERLLRIAGRMKEGDDGAERSPQQLPVSSGTMGERDYFAGLKEAVWAESREDAAERTRRDMAAIGWLLSSQSDRYERNLRAIIETACELTQADGGCFLIPNEDGASYKLVGAEAMPQEHMMEIAKEQQRGFYAATLFGEQLGYTGVRLPQGIRAVMCVPIYGQGRREHNMQWDRRENHAAAPRGYLYLQSHSVLHRFQQQSYTQVRQLAQMGLLSIENDKLQIVSSIDKLTGTYTRKYFETVQKNLVEASIRDGRNFAVLLSDIDRFKSVNDNYGHKRGDDILREVGRLFRESVREDDICCRYGGEEFIFLLPDTTADEALEVAQRIRANVEEAKLLGSAAPLTVSVGAASYPAQGMHWEELKERADQALYHAKESGRNRVSIWDQSMRTAVKRVDKLAGIVTGNLAVDQRNVLALLEFIQLLNEPLNLEETIYRMLGRIMDILEADMSLVVIGSGEEREQSERVYARSRDKDGWLERPKYNRALADQVRRTQTGVYLIDWELSYEHAASEEPVWHSVMLVPLLRSGQAQGVLYLSSPIRAKEYGYKDFNYFHKLGDLVAAALGSKPNK